MSREIIKIETEQQWLDLRRQDITSTKSPALFGLSPYTTKFELYHEQVNGIEIPFQSNERIEKGSRMEQYAAQEVAMREGWTVQPFTDYIRILGERMASSFDYIATKPDGSRGILEIKAVDFFRHRQTWVEGEAPEHIEIQVQHQLECADEFEWAAIAAFTGIYDYTLYYRERERDVGRAIRNAVKRFWADVEARNEPDPDFARDDAVIAKLFNDPGKEPVDLSDDPEFEALLAKFDVAKTQAKEFEKQAAAAKAEIHYRIENAPKAFTNRYRVTAGWTKDTPDRVAEPGEVIKGCKGYRQCLVKAIT